MTKCRSYTYEVQIQTDSEGFRLDALDRSHITFVHLELKSSLFDEFIWYKIGEEI